MCWALFMKEPPSQQPVTTCITSWKLWLWLIYDAKESLPTIQNCETPPICQKPEWERKIHLPQSIGKSDTKLDQSLPRSSPSLLTKQQGYFNNQFKKQKMRSNLLKQARKEANKISGKRRRYKEPVEKRRCIWTVDLMLQNATRPSLCCKSEWLVLLNW